MENILRLDFPVDSDSDEGEDDSYSERDPDIEKFMEVKPSETLTVNQTKDLLTTEIEALSFSIQVPFPIARQLLISNAWNVEQIVAQYSKNPVKVMITSKLLPPSSLKYTTTASDSLAVMECLQRTQKRGFLVPKYLQRPKMEPVISSKVTKEYSSMLMEGESCPICVCTPPPTVMEFFSSSPSTIPSSITQANQLVRGGLGSDETNYLYGLSCGHRFCLDCWSQHLGMEVGEKGLSEINCMASDCNVIVPEDFLFAILKGSPAKDKYFNFIFNRMVAVDHAPMDCELIKKWMSKCKNDEKTATYMAVHTKDCPKCGAHIEKNGGCNHMWVNHAYSLQLEKDFRQSISNRIEERVLNRQGTWIDWQHLLTATDTLRDCRHTLQYTYPMAYYVDKLVDRAFFEHQHAALEFAVEDLAWKIEHSDFTDHAEMQNAMDVCEKRRLNLLEVFETKK